METQKIFQKVLLGEVATIKNETNGAWASGKITDIRLMEDEVVRVIVSCVNTSFGAESGAVYRFLPIEYVEDLIKGERVPCRVAGESIGLYEVN